MNKEGGTSATDIYEKKKQAMFFLNWPITWYETFAFLTNYKENRLGYYFFLFIIKT